MKKSPFRFRYNLYRLQQHVAITTKEAKALWVVLSFLVLGVVITEIQKRQPTFSSDFYAETDSLFLQATASLKAKEGVEDSSKVNAVFQEPADSIIAFFKPTFPININTANQSDLERLPRIGPKMAQRIIDFRENHGGFRKKSDLMKVKGIGAKTLAELDDKIEIN